MARNWVKVSQDEAKQHALYGVRGWLLFYAVGNFIGLLVAFGEASSAASSAGMSISELFAVNDSSVSWLKFVLGYVVASTLVLYWAMFAKVKQFRPIAIVLHLAVFPVIVVAAFAFAVEDLVANDLAKALFQTIVTAAVWVSYLHRSKRVRVTFERKVLAEASIAVAAPEATNSLNSAADMASAMSVHAAQVRSSANAPLPIQATVNTDLANGTNNEHFWAESLAEYEGVHRRPGLYAQCFAAANGDLVETQVLYLRRRVTELTNEHAAAVIAETELAQAVALSKAQAEQYSAVRAGALTPRGECPNCSDAIPVPSPDCPTCGAYLRDGSAWKVIAADEPRCIGLLMNTLNRSRRKITDADVVYLTSLAARHREKVLALIMGNGGTLLHEAARSGLVPEIRSLLASGAAQTRNADGQLPIDLTANDAARAVLDLAPSEVRLRDHSSACP